MKLNDLERKHYAVAALKENFDFKFDTSKLSTVKTKEMLSKIRGLIKEAKVDPSFYDNQKKPAYMKLVFMEQALVNHYNYLSKHTPKIVVENEEVEKSQVILAAQDMIDTVQKMYEDVNDMIVKELPALVDSIQSEMGANESTQFNDQAGGALNALNQALMQAKTTMQSALGVITGQGGAGFDMGAPAGDLAAPELPVDGEEEVDVDVDIPEPDMEEPELPEPPAVGAVGRAKR